MDHPPIVEVEMDRETEFFRPVLTETEFFRPVLTVKRYNPYRKCHGPDSWGWFVLRWEAVPSDEVKR